MVSSFNSQFQTKILIDQFQETEKTSSATHYHNWEWNVVDDPYERKKKLSIRCKVCTSYAEAYVTVDMLRTEETRNLVDRMRIELRRLIATDFSPDCEEARLLNICSKIHNS